MTGLRRPPPTVRGAKAQTAERVVQQLTEEGAAAQLSVPHALDGQMGPHRVHPGERWACSEAPSRTHQGHLTRHVGAQWPLSRRIKVTITDRPRPEVTEVTLANRVTTPCPPVL